MAHNIFSAVFAASRFTRRAHQGVSNPVLTAADEAELRQLQDVHRAAFEPFYFPGRVAYAEATRGYRPDLLTFGAESELVSMPLHLLIGEITRAKGQLRALRRPGYSTDGDREALSTWCLHLAALKAEFDDRASYSNRPHLSKLDQARIKVAARSVTTVMNEHPVHLPIEAWDHIPTSKYPVFEGPEADQAGDSAVEHPTPLTGEQQVANAQADQAREALFALYDQVNQPDVVWTEDGPQYGDTFEDSQDPILVAAVDKAEKHLDDVLRRHRGLLGGVEQWQGFYQEMDAKAAGLAVEDTEEDGQ